MAVWAATMRLTRSSKGLGESCSLIDISSAWNGTSLDDQYSNTRLGSVSDTPSRRRRYPKYRDRLRGDAVRCFQVDVEAEIDACKASISASTSTKGCGTLGWSN